MKIIINRLRTGLALAAILIMTQVASGFYDATLGRWINRDPIGDAACPLNIGLDLVRVSAERNLYGFLNNEPTDAIDVWGLLWVAFGQVHQGKGKLARLLQ